MLHVVSERAGRHRAVGTRVAELVGLVIASVAMTEWAARVFAPGHTIWQIALTVFWIQGAAASIVSTRRGRYSETVDRIASWGRAGAIVATTLTWVLCEHSGMMVWDPLSVPFAVHVRWTGMIVLVAAACIGVFLRESSHASRNTRLECAAAIAGGLVLVTGSLPLLVCCTTLIAGVGGGNRRRVESVFALWRPAGRAVA